MGLLPAWWLKKTVVRECVSHTLLSTSDTPSPCIPNTRTHLLNALSHAPLSSYSLILLSHATLSCHPLILLSTPSQSSFSTPSLIPPTQPSPPLGMIITGHDHGEIVIWHDISSYLQVMINSTNTTSFQHLFNTPSTPYQHLITLSI